MQFTNTVAAGLGPFGLAVLRAAESAGMGVEVIEQSEPTADEVARVHVCDVIARIAGRPTADLLASRHFLPSKVGGATVPFEAIVEAEAPTPQEVVVIRPDGSEVPIEVACSTLEYFGRRLKVLFVRDITRRRQLEQQLERAQQLATVGTVAAAVAHEINNPLTHLFLSADELLSTAASLPDATVGGRIADTARELRQAVRTLSVLVSDLRDLARPHIGDIGPVDLVEALTSALNVARPQLAKKATITTQYHPVRPAQANFARIGQVALNLLLNAGQSIHTGTVSENEVRLSTFMGTAARVCFSVEDTGSGVDEALRERIFDPFFTTKPAGQGTGLGLAICRSIVTTLGGEMWVEAARPRGARFTVCLPSAEGG